MKTNLFSMLLGVLSFMSCSCHAQVGKNSSSAEDNHSYVDLGLPSGTLWATCNIGANSPEEYGDYFAWGETKGYNSGKTDFEGEYKWVSRFGGFTKYVPKEDGKTELDLEDDAAYVNWGPDWRMPSIEQIVELMDNYYTNKEWTSLNGVVGCRITSKKNGNSIFLPAAGFRRSSLISDGSYGSYWSRSLYSNPHALYLCIEPDPGYLNGSFYFTRELGRSVRPVRSSCHAQVGKKSSPTGDTLSYVDLGLPSGTLWATCNIGANSPEEYGDYFAWGETKGYNSGKTDFDWDTYKWCSGPFYMLTKYCTDSSSGYNGFTDDKTELDLEDDAAYVNLGPNWRMPSYEQWQELINSNYTTPQWTTQNGVEGRKITSNANGNSIFLPAADQGSFGGYWSRSLSISWPSLALYLEFDLSDISTGSNERCYGRSVRPVRRPK